MGGRDQALVDQGAEGEEEEEEEEGIKVGIDYQWQLFDLLVAIGFFSADVLKNLYRRVKHFH